MKKFLLLLILSFPGVIAAAEVEAYAVSNDGLVLALAYDDSMIGLYDLNTGDLLHELKSHEDSIQTLNFNSDDSRLISGDWGDYAVIWDVKTGKVIKKKNMGETVMHALYAADDRFLLMAVDEEPLVFFDKNLKKKASSYRMNDRIQLSEDKKFLAGQGMYSPEVEDAVIVVDIMNNKKIIEIPEDSYDDEIYFSKDASIVVVRDYSVFHIWDVVNQKKLGLIDTELDVDKSMINPSNDKELWLTGDNVIEVWDYRTKTLLRSFKINNLDVDSVNDMAFSADGQTAAVSLWLESDISTVLLISPGDFATKMKIEPMSKMAFGLEFINDHTLLINTLYPIEVWDTKNKQMKFLMTKTGNQANTSLQDILKTESVAYQFDGSINGLDTDNKGNIILTGAGSSNGTIAMSNDGKLASVFQNNYTTGYDARYSHDGSLAAFAYHGEHLLIYNTTDSSIYAHLDLGGVPSGFRIVKFSKDDSMLAVGSDDGSVQIVDVKTKKAIKKVELFAEDDYSEGTFSLQWLSQDKLLVGTLEHVFELDITSGAYQKVWETGATALHAYFESGQIKYIAVGQYDNNLIILDQNYKKIKSSTHGSVGRLAVTEDGHKIIALADSYPIVWDIKKDAVIACGLPDENLWAMAFDVDKQEIFVGGDEGKVQKYDINCKEMN